MFNNVTKIMQSSFLYAATKLCTGYRAKGRTHKAKKQKEKHLALDEIPACASVSASCMSLNYLPLFDNVYLNFASRSLLLV